MIVVKDESSLEEALSLLESEGAVRYSDKYEYRTHRSAETLRAKLTNVLSMGEGVLIGTLGEDLPSYDAVWPRIKAELAEEQKRQARQWIKDHKPEANAMKKRMGLEA